MSRAIGAKYELQALAFLKRKQLKLITKNYSSKCGEIDLIMQDKESLVFVEVRYRKEDAYGAGADTITRSKKDKLIRTAKFYLLENDLYDKVACRFDVISIDKQNHIAWLCNAFDAIN